MGGNASPLLAPLTLGVMEYRYLTHRLIGPLPWVSGMCVDIFDIFSLNTVNFKQIAQNVYHNSLNLDYLAVNVTNCAFLDLQVQLNPAVYS